MRVGPVWKKLWRKWTVDKPAAFGDWLWDVFVVQLSAFIYTLSWRHVVTICLLVIVLIASDHGIPLPPELAFAGDLLAYIDVLSLLVLLGILSRLSMILYLLKRAAQRVLRVANHLGMLVQRLDFRHRREGNAQSRSRLGKRAKNDDDGPAVAGHFAWA